MSTLGKQARGNACSAAAIEAAWDDEIAGRIRDVEEGKVRCLSHEEVMAAARAACIQLSR